MDLVRTPGVHGWQQTRNEFTNTRYQQNNMDELGNNRAPSRLQLPFLRSSTAISACHIPPTMHLILDTLATGHVNRAHTFSCQLARQYSFLCYLMGRTAAATCLALLFSERSVARLIARGGKEGHVHKQNKVGKGDSWLSNGHF